MASATQTVVRKSESFSAGPFLKWAGGKGQLLGQLDQYFPKTFNRYFEPFAGSAAVFFHLRRTRGEFAATLMDANPELVNCFEVIKNKINDLLPLLQRHQIQHSATRYYEVRSREPRSMTDLQRAARLIYLNKTCYNGLYRVNASGKFNVPVGSYKNPRIFNREDLIAGSQALRNTSIRQCDFSEVLDIARKGDFLYFDPPYYSDGTGFTGYAVAASGKAAFGAEEHYRLSRVVQHLVKGGCHVVVSNSDTDYIRRIYKELAVRIHTVNARRFINCNGEGRSLVSELVISGP